MLSANDGEEARLARVAASTSVPTVREADDRCFGGLGLALYAPRAVT